MKQLLNITFYDPENGWVEDTLETTSAAKLLDKVVPLEERDLNE